MYLGEVGRSEQDALADVEPVETNEGVCNVFWAADSKDEPGSGGLNKLETLGGMLRNSDQNAVTVIQPTENKRSGERLEHGAWHLSPNATQLA